MRFLSLAGALALLASCGRGFHTEGAPRSSMPPTPPSEASADRAAPVSEELAQRLFGPTDDYALDAIDRSGPARGQKPSCDRESIVAYRGSGLRYEVPASVHHAFVARLARFEELVAEVGVEVYGRAPALLHHAGGYMCRTTWRGRLSEHAFGNALDVGGFTFPALTKSDLAHATERGLALTPAERRGFRIDVGTTWRTARPAHPQAKRFYALLLERVRARSDVFRGMIGPPDPAHTTHLHLDAGPWSFSRYEPPG